MKSAARERTGVSCQGKGAGRREKVEENRGRSGTPCQGKHAARRVKKEFMGGFEEESRVVLWTNSATRCGVMGAGIVRPRGHCHVSEVPKMWQRRMLRRK